MVGAIEWGQQGIQCKWQIPVLVPAFPMSRPWQTSAGTIEFITPNQNSALDGGYLPIPQDTGSPQFRSPGLGFLLGLLGTRGNQSDCCSTHRVDPGCMSPDVKNSIHVGDRILEINGTPIRNVPLDEVGSQAGQTGRTRMWCHHTVTHLSSYLSPD
jgi:hypothetical protein